MGLIKSIVDKHFKNRKAYEYYQKRMNGIKTVEFEKRDGYYLPPHFSHSALIDRTETWVTPIRGRRVIVRLIDFERYITETDRIKWSKWQLVGFYKEKRIEDCTFEEFKEIYQEYLEL